MKLSNKKFNKLIRKGWDELIPEVEEYTPFPAERRKRDRSQYWLNVSAAVLFCLLSGSLFLSQPSAQSEFDLKEVSITSITEYLLTLLIEEEK